MSSIKIYSGLQTSLVAQWLRLHAPNAGVIGSIHGQGTKTPHAIHMVWKNKTKHTTRLVSFFFLIIFFYCSGFCHTLK